MLKGIAAAILIFGIAFFLECKRELRYFIVKRYDLCLPGFNKLFSSKKIVLLADLHGKVYGSHNDILFDKIKKEEPDIILIVGDMILGKKEAEHKETRDFVCRLTDICPVYYSLGNHEQRLKEGKDGGAKEEIGEYMEALKNSGVTFLENTFSDIMFDDLPIRLYGLELPMSSYGRFRSRNVIKKDISCRLGDGDPTKFRILLAHNPLYFPIYKEWGADLTVSGHLHGGLIRIPGIGAVISPQAKLFPKYSGDLTVEGDQAIVVSKGLGTHTINLRFMNQAEVVSVRFLPYDK